LRGQPQGYNSAAALLLPCNCNVRVEEGLRLNGLRYVSWGCSCTASGSELGDTQSIVLCTAGVVTGTQPYSPHPHGNVSAAHLHTHLKNTRLLLLQEGWTPLHEAAFQGQKGVVVRLLGAGAALNAADKVWPPSMTCFDVDSDMTLPGSWGTCRERCLTGWGVRASVGEL
jgi:hypothetical protein